MKEKVFDLLNDMYIGNGATSKESSLQVTLYHGWKEISDLPWTQRSNFFMLAMEYLNVETGVLPHRRNKAMMENILLSISTGLYLDGMCGDIKPEQADRTEKTEKEKRRR